MTAHVLDFSHTPDDAWDQLADQVFREGQGNIAIGFLNRQTETPLHPESYRWPQDRDKVSREIKRRVDAGWEAYFCPALRTSNGRAKGDAVEVWALSFELDAKATDAVLLKQLEAVIVASGTPDHAHVYVLLAEAVDAETSNRLTEQIAKAVSPHVGKWEDNGLLRVPDTLNFKTDPPRPVRLRRPVGKRWKVEDLEALIASRPAKPKRRQGTRTRSVQEMTEDQLRALPGVQRALTQWDSTEKNKRSEAHLAVTRECYKANASQEAAVAVLLSQSWCKGDEAWVRGDVTRIYDDAESEGLSQVPTDEFWDSRPILAHLRDYASDRLLPPWAVLGHTLLRFAAIIPPCYVLPDIVGDYGSLNLFVALVGPSGGGKTTSGAASKRAVPLSFEAPQAPVSTGQGIAKTYMTPGRDSPTYHSNSVIFSVDEVSKFRANISKPDATLLGELNTAWTGRMLGAANADPTKRIILQDHTYRLGLHIGVQPGLVDALLAHEESGFPQRFVWFDAHLPMDAVEPTDVTTHEWQWTPPTFIDGGIQFDREPEKFQCIGLPDFVVKAVRNAHIRRSQGQIDGLDSHRMLGRLKVAAVLMWMDGRSDSINEKDWYLAGQIMAHSDGVRDRAHHYHISHLVKKSEGAARQAGRRAAITETSKNDLLVKQAKERIIKLLSDGAEKTRSEVLTRGMTVSLRDYARTGLKDLEREGVVKVRETTNSNGATVFRCRLVENDG